MDSLSTRIGLLLARRPGLRPAGLARIAGVSTASVADWMTGATQSMKPEPARRLSIDFGCDQNWLMSGVGTPAWREPGDSDHPAAGPVNSGSPPTIRQALLVLRKQLVLCPSSQCEQIGDALKLMATVPDSDRAFDQALALLTAGPEGGG